MWVFHWGHLVDNYGLFLGLGAKFTELVRVGCSFPGLLWCIGKISNMFDIAPTLHESVSGHWLHPPQNCPVVDLYGLSETLSVLLYTVKILSGRTFQPFLVKCLNTNTRQAVHTNQPYLKQNQPCYGHVQARQQLPSYCL